MELEEVKIQALQKALEAIEGGDREKAEMFMEVAAAAGQEDTMLFDPPPGPGNVDFDPREWREFARQSRRQQMRDRAGPGPKTRPNFR